MHRDVDVSEARRGSGPGRLVVGGTAMIAAIVLLGFVAAARGSVRAVAIGGGVSSRGVTVEVWLAGRERAAQRFVDEVSAPGSPRYRRFVGPVTYTRRFGASAAQVRAVGAFLRRDGFAGVHASVDGDYVAGRAPALVADTALTRLPGPGGPSIPSSLRPDVLAVTGLAGAGPGPRTDARGASTPATRATPATCSRWWGQHTATISPAYDGLNRAGVAVCGYSADQIRGAYGLGSLRASRTPTGAGETIALVQGQGAPFEMFRTLTRYARANGLPAPRRDRYRQEAAGGSSGRACDSQDDRSDEGALDSEATYAMAPGATQLMVDGNDCLAGEDHNQGFLDAELSPLTGRGARPQAQIESVTYGLASEHGESGSLRKIFHAIALRAAAEGVTLLASTGDFPGVQPPANDPDVTAVGGTTLGIGSRGQRLFETGWSDGYATRRGDSGAWHGRGIPFASGGGVSEDYVEPAYQRDVVPAALARASGGALGRTLPDIAADADAATGMALGAINTAPHGGTATYASFVGAGTSQSTPLIAGLVADAEQGRATPLGFLNPLLYAHAGSSAFHDIVPAGRGVPATDRIALSTMSPLPEIGASGRVAPYLFDFDDEARRATRQVTARGYDTMTGLGSPNGVAFLDMLRSGR